LGVKIFKVKVSAGAKVGAKVRAFAAAKVGVNADIGSSTGNTMKESKNKYFVFIDITNQTYLVKN
jgi:hypothetical protein